MLYRCFAVLIVIFWIAMTGLLLRKEFSPGDSALREVPVAHVVKLMLLHEQPSELQIYHEKLRVGHLRVHPRVHPEDGRRMIDFTGDLRLVIPGLARQRVAWGGDLEMDKLLAVQRFKLSLSLRDPAGSAVNIFLEPPTRRLRYETRLGDRVTDRGEYSFDEAGARNWLLRQGIDPAMLPALRGSQAAAPVVKALQSSMEIHGEKIDTYLVTVEQGGQTLLEFHVSQLGQILRATTFVGYSAMPDDIVP